MHRVLAVGMHCILCRDLSTVLLLVCTGVKYYVTVGMQTLVQYAVGVCNARVQSFPILHDLEVQILTS